MYERHFGFAEKPFNLTPDPRHLLLTPSHRKALAALGAGVRARAGILVLTGEVGTGKTTLLRHFVSSPGAGVRTAIIPYPVVTAGELFHAILQDLGVPFSGGTLTDATAALSKALLEAKAAGIRVALLIDEAQSLPPRVLDQLRLLSDLVAGEERLLTLILVGQPELTDLLAKPALRGLAERVASRSAIEPLSEAETRDYVRRHLIAAGGRGAEIDAEAAGRVHVLSGGVPRVINLLCSRALMGAFGRGLAKVDATMVDLAASEVLPAPVPAPSRLPRRVIEIAALFLLGVLLVWPLRQFARSRSAAPSSATPIAFASTPVPPGELPGPFPAVRCGDAARTRPAAISAIESFLGTPGFDSAQSTLSFEQWRALRLPAIATFRSEQGPCEAAVMPIDEATSHVADASGDYLMENQRLKSAYLGTAIICFVDREGVLAKPERARFIWARTVLEKHRLVTPGAPDSMVREALARVGARVGARGEVSVEGALLAGLYSLDAAAAGKQGTPP